MTLLVFVGESSSGKSTYIRNYFNSKIKNAFITVGIDFGRIEDVEKKDIIEFWEIAGFEHSPSFKAIAEPFLATHLQVIDELFIIFDASNPASLQNSLLYIDWLQGHHCQIIKMSLIGNKTDLGIHPVYSATNCTFTAIKQ